jgi:hypothetical protein
MRPRSERASAISVGVLYIAATVAGLSMAAGGSLLGGPGISADLAANETQVIVAAFSLLTMAVAVAGVGFMMYPILMQDAGSKAKEGLSLWYVGSRITEGAIFVVGVLGLLSLLAISKEFANGGGSGATGLQAAGTVMWNAFNWASILAQTVFCVGAVMLYYLLYVSRRVPRWLSVWGLIGAPLMLVAGLSFAVTGNPNSTFSSVLYAPLGLQEMALAVWLIARGFNPPAKRGPEVSQ